MRAYLAVKQENSFQIWLVIWVVRSKTNAKKFMEVFLISQVICATTVISTVANAERPAISGAISPASNDALAQVTSVSQLSDVQPTDWAFQALQSLVRSKDSADKTVESAIKQISRHVKLWNAASVATTAKASLCLS